MKLTPQIKQGLLATTFIIGLFLTGCTDAQFLSSTIAATEVKEIAFGGSETRSMTDVVIAIDQSQSMLDAQDALSNGIQSMATALHEYPVTYHVITPTAFMHPHIQGMPWPYGPIFYRDTQDQLLFQIWDDKFFPDTYTNPFSTINQSSIRYFDENGSETTSLTNASRPYRVSYKTETLPAIAKYAILQTDSYQKAITLSLQLAAAVKVGDGGDSTEMSMCSMLKYVRDRITNPASPDYRENPLLALLNVSDENSADHISNHNGLASKCFEKAEITGSWRDSWKYDTVENCENDPENCVDDTRRTGYSYRYYLPTMEATCTKIVDGVETQGTYTSAKVTNCYGLDRDICQFNSDQPMPHQYTNRLDIDAVGATQGCIAGTTTQAKVTSLGARSSSYYFLEHSEDRETQSFEHNGKQFENFYDFRAKSNFKVYDVYARNSPRVRTKLQRLDRKMAFSYHNDEMKQTIESSSSAVRATMNDVTGKALMDILEEKTLGYFFAGIVTTEEDQNNQLDPNASVGQSQINLADHIKEQGSSKSASAIYSIRNSDYASFMVPAMRDFVDKFALSTYDLDLGTKRQVIGIGISSPEGVSSVLDYTTDPSESRNHVALLQGETLQFNIEKLQSALKIETEQGKQLSGDDLEGYTIQVLTTRK